MGTIVGLTFPAKQQTEAPAESAKVEEKEPKQTEAPAESAKRKPAARKKAVAPEEG